MNTAKPRVLFVSHSASRNGATILLLAFLRWLRPRVEWDIEILVHGSGALLDEFRSLGRTIVWRDPAPRLDSLLPRSFARVKRGIEAAYARVALPSGPYDLVYANTTAAAPLIAALAGRARTVLWHVHELDYAIASTLTKPAWMESFRSSSRFVAVSDAVRHALVANHGIDAGRIDLVHGFIEPRLLGPDALRARREHVRTALGIRADAFVVGACGSLGWRKGSDLFLQIAQRAAAADPNAHIQFLWVGGTRGEPAALEFDHDMHRLGLASRCRLVPTAADVLDHYCAMDAFALTSREDPFPLVVLEAAEHGVPTVCFDGAGGANEFVAGGAGVHVPYLDVDAFARQLVALRDDAAHARALGACAQAKVRQAHHIDAQAPKLLRSVQDSLAQHLRAAGAGEPPSADPLATPHVR